MVNFEEVCLQKFLTDYWQKKPLAIRQALPDFINPLTPDELAGLSMEEEIESRIVFETPGVAPFWHLKRGPFAKKDFKTLPATHWTLLVQGVDRFVPEVSAMLNYFTFIPQWRIDDVMISYAAEHGSVGPHYDNYDVFLYQAKGRRRWSLTTHNCHENNHLPHVDLRIMQQFQVEEEYLLEEGDMLYLPPHVGHYGVATSGDCMTYSFGYRSYQGQELWDSFAEYLAEKKQSIALYQDPSWDGIQGNAEIPRQAWQNAKKLLLQMLEDENELKSWFGCFVTHLDQHAEALLPDPVEEDFGNLTDFINQFLDNGKLIRNPLCRFAYQEQKGESLLLFINGDQWEIDQVSEELVKHTANSRELTALDFSPYMNNEHDRLFLWKLWNLQWLEFAGS